MTPAGGDHGDWANELAYHINGLVREHALGKVYAAETGFVLERNPDTVRAPDVAFIAAERLEQAQTPRFIPIPPDLAVEVNSPNDVLSAVVEKVEWWLAHGTRAVRVVDPSSKTVTAYRPGNRAHVVRLDQTLDGTDILPGFALPLEQLFTA